MYLEHLSFINFKNYKGAELRFSPKINCFVGDNGSGKTNILDAVHYLSFSKSHLNPIDNQNIKHDEQFFVLKGDFYRAEKYEQIYCSLKRNSKKVFKRNQKEYNKLSEHIGLFPLVICSPRDTNLINEGSEERRKFMNGVISQYDKLYLQRIMNYNKLLSQRNKVLKQYSNSNAGLDKGMLEIYDEQMIPLGNYIYSVRNEFIQQLLPIFRYYYNYISLQQEPSNILYQSDLHNKAYDELLRESLQKDQIMQYTTVGIHKDDLEFTLHEYPLKKLGSQGQQKSFVTSVKLAQFDFIHKVTQNKPMLLLDDIFDKLDDKRVKQLVHLVASDHFGQIFITDTDQKRIKHILREINIDYKLFRVENGSVQPM